MIRRLFCHEGSSFDPYRNLAVEEHLLRTVPEDGCILYLWQNENTVVIGQNQNAWKECRTALLEQEGGKLARRLSGGGAVFHDLGNLNFTFLVPSDCYDLERQLRVIREACAALGVETETSGRNDVLAGGRKFSGNAFYHSQGKSYHHGTLLISADMQKMGRYLNPSRAKLEAKGVASVRARVVNLRELQPDITVPAMRQAMLRAFEHVYGARAERIAEEALDEDFLRAQTARNGSWEWLYGRRVPFTFSCEQRFPWGIVQLELSVQSGVVTDAACYSDSMQVEPFGRLSRALVGARFTQNDLCARVRAAAPELSEDICAMILRQDL